MTRTMVLMFMAPSLYAQACSASQNALPAAGRHQAAFQISPYSSTSRTPSVVIATPCGGSPAPTPSAGDVETGRATETVAALSPQSRANRNR
jgi:hypothetical protein